MVARSRIGECRVCSGSRCVTILSGLRSRLGEVYSLKRCKTCSFISVAPLPAEGNLKRYYSRLYWQEYKGRMGYSLALLYKLRMYANIREIKRLIPRKGRILEWGAGDGSLVGLLTREGFECWGIDVYRDRPKERRILNTTIEDADFQNEFFDAITCFHVFEHIANPVEALKKAFCLLKTGGLLVIEVPNIGSLGFRIFKKRWYALDIPLHLNHFTKEVLEKLFGEMCRGEIIKVGYFSHRASASSVVVSLFPSLSPPRVRNSNFGRYPFFMMVLYLTLQIMVYPFVLMEALMKRGEVIIMYVRKLG